MFSSRIGGPKIGINGCFSKISDLSADVLFSMIEQKYSGFCGMPFSWGPDGATLEVKLQ